MGPQQYPTPRGNIGGGAKSAAPPPWVRKLGPLAPLAIVLVKGKSLLALFKLKFLLSLGAFAGYYWALYGAKFGVGFAILILVHEMGHFIAIRRRGLPAEMPVFFPGLGAYVRWTALGRHLAHARLREPGRPVGRMPGRGGLRSTLDGDRQ